MYNRLQSKTLPASLQGIFEIWLNFSEFFDISLFSFEIILHFAFAAGN